MSVFASTLEIIISCVCMPNSAVIVKTRYVTHISCDFKEPEKIEESL